MKYKGFCETFSGGYLSNGLSLFTLDGAKLGRTQKRTIHRAQAQLPVAIDASKKRVLNGGEREELARIHLQ